MAVTATLVSRVSVNMTMSRQTEGEHAPEREGSVRSVWYIKADSLVVREIVFRQVEAIVKITASPELFVSYLIPLQHIRSLRRYGACINVPTVYGCNVSPKPEGLIGDIGNICDVRERICEHFPINGVIAVRLPVARIA